MSLMKELTAYFTILSSPRMRDLVSRMQVVRPPVTHSYLFQHIFVLSRLDTSLLPPGSASGGKN